jgi:hypothetical protein
MINRTEGINPTGDLKFKQLKILKKQTHTCQHRV